MNSDYPLTQTETSSIVMVDIAGGWRYDFPKVYDRDNDQETMVNWLIRHGIPRWLAEQEQNNLRFYSVPDNATTDSFPPVHEDLNP